MKWLLVIVFLSSGVHQEKHITSDNCIDAIIEASIVRGNDLWSATCLGPDDQHISTATKEDWP